MSLFSIGLSGLNTAQNALTTTSHNFANSATEGYSRQNTIVASAGGQYTSQGFYGYGSNTTTVIRVYDEFLTGQLRGATSASASLAAYSDQIAQIDNLLADQKGGLAPLMQKFFAAVQAVADTPADPAARQGMLSAGQALVGQVRSASNYFKQLQSGVNEQVGTAVTQVNAYTRQIANLNGEITRLKAASGGQPPNDLLDQRDQAVAELTRLVGAKVVVQDGGTYNVFVGNGQPLVMGNDSYDLKAVASAADPNRTVVAYTLPNGSVYESEAGAITGGSLGGLLQFRTETLDAAQSAIGRLSLAIGQSFNAQHKLGMDLNGAIGTDMFELGTATVLPNANNAVKTTVATATIDDASALTTSDYKLQFDGTNYTLTRLSDNQQVIAPVPAASASYPLTFSAEGFSVSINAAMGANDSFTIQPTRNAATGFDMAISDPAKIAAASPARADAAAGNTGGATASLTNVTAPFAIPTGKITATFDGTNYVFTDADGTVLAGTPPGTDIDFTINGLTFTFSGTPKAGDKFELGGNAGGVKDNGNMLSLAKLQNAKTIGGVSSFSDAYAQLVNDVGTRAKSVKIASASQDSITTQIKTAQQSVSGVNMDEETVSMLRFQQLYQANARVIQTASSLFDTIIGIGR
ncbi:flagellar hook-associated protein FlgK [Cupriavidus oxalaticus]|jgi:flagellar hook-associated protein 1 FlgK|uniref:Flagellar hook-associated protein 1 n=1 Tax=Cupriavidus oxalaticus TaxID=96344 RepID=A0A375FIM3_9BURK|nr:flagellar hook-associated protein FlgK [Cupriavidus oxalaticus]QRQ84305.1 flagellar hook-associated protein FlgK [Cupriavidus oxalaticus]QRQ91608.1 flagellar hook-associated protein FlgK [Cupriavidus oxalaticus]WQD86180.1 flagellar hook-associated protein FlgK [Cupriavidus oxalaticus]SPC05084.1 Flagellar hook-associated protein FlgK [Cupriavidus oxalaticus]SPC18226.1 Flagellar hook-associated protein FlgK [Cupriavidus oxalaticus]